MSIFNWCEFCKHDNDFSFDSVMECDCCSQKYDEEPTNFQEKASVTAYRIAISGTAEKLIRDLYTHDREKTVSELAELKGE